ncbi:MAG: Fe-S cluster assembly protein SufD, partial [Atopostipes suicloacalis]|nr:Fe-S cluster assembly protein SufD [Atopostipes suicloacalis]
DFIQRSSGALEKINKKEGLFVASFEELFQRQDDCFKKHYEQSEFLDLKDQFNAFNLTYLTSGTFIYIPKGLQVEEAIHLAFFNEKIKDKEKNHQLYIYAEKNTAIEIIESYYSLGDVKKSSKLNVHVHIETADGANVKYTAIDELDKKTQSFFRRTGKTGPDSTLNLALGAMNQGDTIEDLRIDLLGAGSSADVKAVAISRENQRQIINTKVVNHGAHTVGNIYQHGVVLDQSRLSFNGVGDVLKNAKFSDAQQESRILMLSEEGRADTNPILLINEYELTAGHAASISRVDEKQLYYLMSRGLERKEAEKLVIRGFLGTVLSAISVKDVRENLVKTIERKLALL